MADPVILTTPAAEPAPAKLKVFISYSRVDGVFVEHLCAAISARGYEAYFDQQTIVPGEDWRDRLDKLILGAESVVFVISPDSVDRWDSPPPAESVCAWEIRRTKELGKRLVAVHFRTAVDMTIPPDLSAIHYVDASTMGRAYPEVAHAFKARRDAERQGLPEATFAPLDDRVKAEAERFGQRFVPSAEFDATLDALDTALKVHEVLWLRQHTKWVGRAAEWVSTEEAKREGKLLPAGEIAEVQALKGLRPTTAPDFPPVLIEFLARSIDKDERDSTTRRRIIGRAFVKPAGEALQRGEHEHALRLAAAGALSADDLDFQLVPELWEPAARALFSNNTRAALIGHTSAVLTSAFSSDGQRIVTASDDNTARIWDTATGNQIFALRGHSKTVNSTSFSPDGRRIVTASYDNTARIWDTATGNQIFALRGHSKTVNSASFSPDGRRIVTASDDNTVRIWDAVTGNQIVALEGHTKAANDHAKSASFSPDATRIVTVFDKKTAWIRDAATGKEIAALEGHDATVTIASFSSDGQRILTASWDHTARIWDAATGKQIAALEGHRENVNSASFSPDGKRVVTTSVDRTARVWDRESGRQIALLEGHEIGTGRYDYGVKAASFSPDGKRVVTASQDHTARIWDAESGIAIANLRAHERAVNSASFSPDGRLIVTASDDHSARIFGTESDKEISVLNAQAGPVRTASFSPDGRRIVTATEDTMARVWDSESGTQLASLEGHGGPVRRASFSPDSRRIVTASSDKTARVWDVEQGH